MKKALFLIVLFLVAGSVFAQNYTFQGLPWGSTREQVIAKLGKPSESGVIRLAYLVNLNGYNVKLKVLFHESKFFEAYYSINEPPFRDLNETQVKIAYLALFNQLIEKYGAFHEVLNDEAYNEDKYWVWHFNNFHIYISSIILNDFVIGYCSNVAWEKKEEVEIRNMRRLPNRDL